MEWYEIREELLAFAEALFTADRDFDIFYMLRKPWKWEDAYHAWVSAGRPEEFSP